MFCKTHYIVDVSHNKSSSNIFNISETGSCLAPRLVKWVFDHESVLVYTQQSVLVPHLPVSRIYKLWSRRYTVKVWGAVAAAAATAVWQVRDVRQGPALQQGLCKTTHTPLPKSSPHKCCLQCKVPFLLFLNNQKYLSIINYYLITQCQATNCRSYQVVMPHNEKNLNKILQR